ncbi:MAG: hypothetical protein HOK61_02825, partial [Alphaproteobacteria bacterium]|nr:hypothetical protein [Alphaproteobacteria bacterium]
MSTKKVTKRPRKRPASKAAVDNAAALEVGRKAYMKGDFAAARDVWMPLADTGDAEVFASGAFSNPSNWKSGPLDVRWDDNRKVWAAGLDNKTYLVKMTNTYNPSHFSYEVQRSDSRSQYSRDTLSAKAFSKAAPIHDPEFEAYTANLNNVGAFERLDFTGLEFPHYEAFIIRETKDEV